MTAAWILILTTLLVGSLWVFGVYRAAAELPNRKALTWQALFLFLAVEFAYLAVGSSGIAANFNVVPPPLAFFILSLIVVSTSIAISKWGKLLASNLSFAVLIAFQSFRALAEFVLIVAYQEGLAPVQMTWEGRNFDIWVAISAVVVALVVRKSPQRKLIWIWNFFGLLSLMNIAVIAFLSMPAPWRQFMNEPSNVWVTGSPYILLPGALVLAAFTGHWLVFRKLRMTA